MAVVLSDGSESLGVIKCFPNKMKSFKEITAKLAKIVPLQHLSVLNTEMQRIIWKLNRQKSRGLQTGVCDAN